MGFVFFIYLFCFVCIKSNPDIVIATTSTFSYTCQAGSNDCRTKTIICPSTVNSCTITCKTFCEGVKIYSSARTTYIDCQNAACDGGSLNCGRTIPDPNPTSITIDNMLGHVDSCIVNCYPSGACKNSFFNCIGDVRCMFFILYLSEINTNILLKY